MPIDVDRTLSPSIALRSNDSLHRLRCSYAFNQKFLLYVTEVLGVVSGADEDDRCCSHVYTKSYESSKCTQYSSIHLTLCEASLLFTPHSKLQSC